MAVVDKLVNTKLLCYLSDFIFHCLSPKPAALRKGSRSSDFLNLVKRIHAAACRWCKSYCQGQEETCHRYSCTCHIEQTPPSKNISLSPQSLKHSRNISTHAAKRNMRESYHNILKRKKSNKMWNEQLPDSYLPMHPKGCNNINLAPEWQRIWTATAQEQLIQQKESFSSGGKASLWWIQTAKHSICNHSLYFPH